MQLVRQVQREFRQLSPLPSLRANGQWQLSAPVATECDNVHGQLVPRCNAWLLCAIAVPAFPVQGSHSFVVCFRGKFALMQQTAHVPEPYTYTPATAHTFKLPL